MAKELIKIGAKDVSVVETSGRDSPVNWQA
jgi:hypothetical protein